MTAPWNRNTPPNEDPNFAGNKALSQLGVGKRPYPTPGVRTTQIDPTNDLRSKQITGSTGYTPFQGVQGGNDDYTNTSNKWLADAYGAAQGASYGGPMTLTQGADTLGMRGGYSNYLNDVVKGGTDRGRLAADSFQLIQDEQAPRRAMGFQDVGRRAAALGRVGAGMTTNDLTGLEQDYTRQDNLTKRDLALRAAGDTLQDRLGIAGALQGGFNTLFGADRDSADFGMRAGSAAASAAANKAGLLGSLAGQKYGMGSDLRNEARGERGTRRNFELDEFDRGSRLRDELRGERGYQTDAAQQGIENAIRQRALEEQLLGNEVGRDRDEMADAYDFGWGYDPSVAYGKVGGEEQAQANDAWSGVGEIVSGLGQQAGLGRPGGRRLPPLEGPAPGGWQDDYGAVS
jgi:hypothetical protein